MNLSLGRDLGQWALFGVAFFTTRPVEYEVRVDLKLLRLEKNMKFRVVIALLALAAVLTVWSVPAYAGQHTLRVWVHKKAEGGDYEPVPGARFTILLTAQCIETTKKLSGVTDDTGAIVFENVYLSPKAASYAAKVSVNGKMREFFTFKPKSKDLYYTVTLPNMKK